MKRWIIFPMIAVLAIVVGLVLNFASLNSNQTAAAQTQKQHTETSQGAGGTTSNSVQTDATQKPQVVPTSTQQTMTAPDETPVDSQKLLDSLTKDQLQDLIIAAGENATKAAIQRVAPSVVQIQVEASVSNPYQDYFNNFQYFPQQQQRETAMGSGFFIESLGQKFVLTNNHVVDGADKISLTTANGTTLQAKVVGTDEVHDLAVLQVIGNGADGIAAAPLGDSDQVEVGDWVTAIGNPFGLEHTVTAGIVSYLHRNISRPDQAGNFQNMIQTDAAINPGNSGGPLVNAKGEVIGINSAIIANAPGLGFAIAINTAKNSISQMVQGQNVKRAWLGVKISDLTADLAQQLGLQVKSGVVVVNVQKNSPSVGILQPNDVILSIDGEAIPTVTDLIDNVQYRTVGETVKLEILRNSQKMTVEIVLGARPSDEELAKQNPTQSPAPKAPSGNQKTDADSFDLASNLGIAVQANSQQFASDNNLSTNNGMVITKVESGSKAEQLGFKANDVIVGLNDKQIDTSEDWDQAVKAIQKAAKGGAAYVQVGISAVRGKTQLYVSFPVFFTKE
ncbi:trypsin-like peptidase domain-containing protein [Candidatus Acetothermia bacterium]|nr:trypsin-like peptidase domain-containing protein [Candidatus Acetothermia bacterium]MBI3642915.1 trypsin-like peptidase domain-containing protein [Candidatus Acetothermia bacterium]